MLDFLKAQENGTKDAQFNSPKCIIKNIDKIFDDVIKKKYFHKQIPEVNLEIMSSKLHLTGSDFKIKKKWVFIFFCLSSLYHFYEKKVNLKKMYIEKNVSYFLI